MPIVFVLFICFPVKADLTTALEKAWDGLSSLLKTNRRTSFCIRLENTDIIQVDTDKSVSIAYLPFVKKTVNLKYTPLLTFSWRRLGPAVDTDLTIKGGDDRTLAGFMWVFPISLNEPPRRERLLRPFC